MNVLKSLTNCAIPTIFADDSSETSGLALAFYAILFVVLAVWILIRKLAKYKLIEKSYDRAKRAAATRKPSSYDELLCFTGRVPVDLEKEIGFATIDKTVPADAFVDEFVASFYALSDEGTLMDGAKHADLYERVVYKPSSKGKPIRVDPRREEGDNQVRVILVVDKIEDETGSGDLKLAVASVVVSDWLTSIMISVRRSVWSLKRQKELERLEKGRGATPEYDETDDLQNCASPLLADDPEKKAERLARLAIKAARDVVAKIENNAVKPRAKNDSLPNGPFSLSFERGLLKAEEELKKWIKLILIALAATAALVLATVFHVLFHVLF